MMRIKIKVNSKRFFIPVPYALLHLFIGILTSKQLQMLVNRAVRKKAKKKFQIPYINRKDLKPFLKELSKHRGVLLVETKLKDGTEVSIRL
jgi:hypothetical protein